MSGTLRPLRWQGWEDPSDPQGERAKILTVEIPDEYKEQLLANFLDVDAIKAEEARRSIVSS